MRRREFLAVGALAAIAVRGKARGESPERTSLGIVEHCYGQRTAFERKTKGKATVDDPGAFLDFCRARGAGGAQLDLQSKDSHYWANIAARMHEAGMFLEASVNLPENASQTPRATAAIQNAFECGAPVIRTVVLPGRRYERFHSVAEFRGAVEHGQKSVERFKPLIDEYDGRIRLAIENHKDWRTTELVALLERLDSPHIGVCLDTGNSIALLEDPMETVEQLAPWAFSTHLKDMAVEEYEDGFLLAEVPLGKGFLDLPRIVNTIRKARPEIHFNLEMITRDPLKVPCLTSGYWPTFEAPMGWPLARTLKMVRAHASKTPLPRVSQLDDEARVKLEDDNVRACLKYASDRLGLAS